MSDTVTEGKLVRAPNGQFVKGYGGNPNGRPKGSKNKVTLLKIAGEEAMRERNYERMQLVMDMVIDAALDGDKSAQKLVWDAGMSKATLSEDKAAGQQQKITVHRMEVKSNSREGEENAE